MPELRPEDWENKIGQVVRDRLERSPIVRREPEFLDDVYQDVALIYLSASKKGLNVENPVAWVVTVTGNCIVNWIRKRAGRSRSVTSQPHLYPNIEQIPDSEQDSPLQTLMKKQQRELASHRLKILLSIIKEESSSLKMRHAAIFAKRFFEGKSAAQLAGTFPMNESSLERCYRRQRDEIIERVKKRLKMDSERSRLFEDLLHEEHGFQESMRAIMGVIQKHGVGTITISEKE